MNKIITNTRCGGLTVILSCLLASGFAQQKDTAHIFPYIAFMDESHDGKWVFMEPVKGQDRSITRFDFSRPGEVKIVYAYGSKLAQYDTFKQVKGAGFDKEPRQMKGHVLLGAYFNTTNSMYELYYLAPDKSGLLERMYWGPGSPGTGAYFSERKDYNPFSDTLLAHSVNSTIKFSSPAPNHSGQN